MLQINRKLFALPVNIVYFKPLKSDSRFEPKIVQYTHILKPSRQLKGQKTVHINLKQDENTLLHGMSKQVINLLDQNRISSWKITRLHHPKREELLEFQQIYNRFAKGENDRKLTKSDIQTLQLLQEQGGLVITKLENEEAETICTRIYAVSDEVVMVLYHSGQEIMSEQMNKGANYFLCWENIRYFRTLGYQIYDFGDIKNSNELEEIKENFGGKTVTVFSGYVTKSLFGNLMLHLNRRGL
ncbi:hypothetical protein D1B33_10245 [Lysinibacillus yapensis]|uniref:Uncharacterized protein n=1 Tax=Ureibacillus yapensis TaxID=2304605 RepID=A0A396S7C7_9BACL|nr:hypothetical protein [Lysinibacillus yapensis]RHW36761.1 hypothetical protein D1B33_10245 [Lysinibacillus yapensis]